MQILGLASGVWRRVDTIMLVSAMQNSGVGGIAQRQPSTPGILHSGGIKALSYILEKTALKYPNSNQNDSSRSEKLVKQ